MPETTRQIIGLEKEVIANDSGAPVRFHVLRQYSVSLVAPGSSSVTYASFFSQEAYEAGKSPLLHLTVQINAAPAGESADFPAWFADRLQESATPHDLTGARTVYAAPDMPLPEGIAA